jgi:hypothetical protein
MNEGYVKINKHLYNLMIICIMAATMNLIEDNLYLKCFYLGFVIVPIFKILCFEITNFVEWTFKISGVIIH